MMVVADAGPLHYLILIEAVNVLEPLYSRVLLPRAVSSELLASNAPRLVREWMAYPPTWCEIRPDPPPDPTLGFLDAGEQAAIALALSLHADSLLIDERAGRAEAARRHLPVTGTVGVLAEAHRVGLLDFERAVRRLRETNFYLSENILRIVREQLSKGSDE
jgi:predicted nucleic acid-binding protein